MDREGSLRRRTLAIPGDLRAFLVEVNGKVERGEDDAMIESDDLLQADGVYGGRNEAGGDVWGFTYWPTDDFHPKWELAFSREELRRIAAGEVGEVTLWVCGVEGCGYAYSAGDVVCRHPGVWRGRGAGGGGS